MSAFEIFGDFGIVGGQDLAPDLRQNTQLCINYYPEINQQNPKEILALLGCPGLDPLCHAPGGGAPGFSPSQTQWPAPSSVQNLPVRGFWVLPGTQTALAVIGNTCYLVTATLPTATSFPTIGLTKLGLLQTNTGIVSIRDNGVGGVAVIVDGPNGYYYVYGVGGANVGPVGTWVQITDPAFLGADRVAYIDGWWIFNEPGTQRFYTPGAPYSTVFNGSYFALKDGASDNLMGVQENKEELWLPGERTTEIWYNAGGQYFGFQRLVGTLIQVGCKATQSIARFSSKGQDGLIWFGRSERGENVIIRTTGLSAETISTPAFGNEVATYPVTSDAFGYTYQEDTHEFYVLTFPTADVTWCYDSQTGLLHKRLSYDPVAGQFHRHRSNAFMNFQGMRIVGDYQNGTLYNLTRKAYTDAGWPLLAKRRSPHVWDKGMRGRVFTSWLQLDFTPGVGNSTGMGSDPVATLRISRDGGATFGNAFPASLGKQGKTQNRVIWRRLSMPEDRDVVFDVEVIDPVNRDMIGATLRADGEY